MNIIIWLTATCSCVFLQACFSMIEMAALSFNRVRLQYLASHGVKRALWLQKLLKKPYRLFGTVILAVNCALQIGSQSARELYKALHLAPDLAPLSQILLVVILGELAPLFAARRCSEHVIMLLSPLIYFTYQILSPIIWLVSLTTQAIYRLTGCRFPGVDLSREHLQKLLETPEEEGDTFNFIVTNMMAFRLQSIRQAMHPLSSLIALPHHATVLEVKQKLQDTPHHFVVLFEKKVTQVVGIVPLDKLVDAKETEPAINYSLRPLILSANRSLSSSLEILSKTNQIYAVVMGRKQGAIGILLIESIFEKLFCSTQKLQKPKHLDPLPLIERSVAGNMRVADFNREYGTRLPEERAETLAQLLLNHLEGPASQGDHISIGALDLAAEETGLTGIKTVRVKTSIT